MKRFFYILLITLSCIFVASCGVKDESQFEEAVVTGEPIISWGVQQSQGQYWYPTYWYEWSVESALQQAAVVKQYEAESNRLKSKVERLQAENEQLRLRWDTWAAENTLEQAAVVEQYEAESEQLKNRIDKLVVGTDLLQDKIAGLQAENNQLRDEGQEFWKFAMLEREYGLRANLLKNRILRLQIENQELKAELEDKGSWLDFWQMLKTTDGEIFVTVGETLSVFVKHYTEPSNRITVKELQAILKMMKGDSDEEENQKIKSEESNQDQENSQDQDYQEENHCCEKSVRHDGQEQSCQY